MKSLYSEKDHRYTKEAEALDADTFRVIRPLFNKWAEDGYSPREIAHIMQATINEMELYTVLGYDNKDTKPAG